jgi:hypothetical protein
MSTEKRAPLLSDDEIRDTFMYGSLIRDPEHGFKSGAGYVRYFYEDLITRGELMVVKTVKPKWTGGDLRYQGSWECPNCRRRWYPSETPKVGEFCVCGSKIIE